jgi:hypothetical protein
MSHRIKRFAAFAIFASFYLFAAVDSILDFGGHQGGHQNRHRNDKIKSIRRNKVLVSAPFSQNLKNATDGRPKIDVLPSLRCRWQIKPGQLLNLSKKDGRFHPERTADVEDASQGWIGLSQLNETDEGALVARPCRQSLLAHLLPQTIFPQQLSESCGRIEFRLLLIGRGHTSMWQRKYITRRL